MTYQDELINQLMRNYETAIINHNNHPSLSHSQSLAVARHELMKFLKGGK